MQNAEGEGQSPLDHFRPLFYRRARRDRGEPMASRRENRNIKETQSEKESALNVEGSRNRLGTVAGKYTLNIGVGQDEMLGKVQPRSPQTRAPRSPLT